MVRSSGLAGNRLTSDFMYPLIELWLNSDQTQQKICEEYSVKPHTFNYWRKKYREEKEAAIISKEEVSDFVPLQVSAPIAGGSSYFAEIQYPNGILLRIGQPISLEALKDLLPR